MKTDLEQRIEKLPKWAQEYIETLERSVDAKQSLINQLHRAEQDHKPDWHRHEFFELVGDHGMRERYICANTISLRAGGVEIDIRPDSFRDGGGVAISFDVDYDSDEYCNDPDGARQYAALLPQASNVVHIKRLKKP